MSNSFAKQLGMALSADYFEISSLLSSDKSQNLDFVAPSPMWNHYNNVYLDLGIKFTLERTEEDPENFAWLSFSSKIEKSIAEDYFKAFNFHNRTNAMIVLPNLNEDRKAPNEDVCCWYLTAIESFYRNNFHSNIPIPFGICESNPKERMFMVYSETGCLGLHKGTNLFKNSPIRFVK